MCALYTCVVCLLITYDCKSYRNMPNCFVPECSNCTRKGKIYMARFPSDQKRKKVWMHNIGKTTWEPNESSRVCAIHFSSDMWEKERVDGKQKLKHNAVPTIFPARLEKSVACSITNDHINESIGTQLDVDIKEENDDCLSSNVIPLDVIPLVSHATSVVSSNLTDPSISDCSNKICNKVDEVEWLKKQIEETKKKLELANKKLDQSDKIILQLNRSNYLFKNRIKRLIYERTKLQAENDKCDLKSSLKKLFNDDQIKVLMGQPLRGAIWSNETIKKSLRLKFFCGSYGYQELRKQNMPLPSERTLRRKLENMKLKRNL